MSAVREARVARRLELRRERHRVREDLRRAQAERELLGAEHSRAAAAFYRGEGDEENLDALEARLDRTDVTIRRARAALAYLDP